MSKIKGFEFSLFELKFVDKKHYTITILKVNRKSLFKLDKFSRFFIIKYLFNKYYKVKIC